SQALEGRGREAVRGGRLVGNHRRRPQLAEVEADLADERPGPVGAEPALRAAAGVDVNRHPAGLDEPRLAGTLALTDQVLAGGERPPLKNGEDAFEGVGLRQGMAQDVAK